MVELGSAFEALDLLISFQSDSEGGSKWAKVALLSSGEGTVGVRRYRLCGDQTRV